MQNPDDSPLLDSVLREVFPDACSQVGKANLRDIIARKGQVQFASMEGASRLDLSLALTLLASGAAIASHVLTFIKNSKDMGSKSPPEIILQSKISLSPELMDKLEPATLDKLLAALVSRTQMNTSAPGSDDAHKLPNQQRL